MERVLASMHRRAGQDDQPRCAARHVAVGQLGLGAVDEDPLLGAVREGDAREVRQRAVEHLDALLRRRDAGRDAGALGAAGHGERLDGARDLGVVEGDDGGGG